MNSNNVYNLTNKECDIITLALDILVSNFDNMKETDRILAESLLMRFDSLTMEYLEPTEQSDNVIHLSF